MKISKHLIFPAFAFFIGFIMAKSFHPASNEQPHPPNYQLKERRPAERLPNKSDLVAILEKIKSMSSAEALNFIELARNDFDKAGGDVGILLQRKLLEKLFSEENSEEILGEILKHQKGASAFEYQLVFDAAAEKAPEQLRKWLESPPSFVTTDVERQALICSAAKIDPEAAIQAIVGLKNRVNDQFVSNCFSRMADFFGVAGFDQIKNMPTGIRDAARIGLSKQLLKRDLTTNWKYLSKILTANEKQSIGPTIATEWYSQRREDMISVIGSPKSPDRELQNILLRHGSGFLAENLSPNEIIELAKASGGGLGTSSYLSTPLLLAVPNSFDNVPVYLDAIPEGAAKDSLVGSVAYSLGSKASSEGLNQIKALIGDPKTKLDIQNWSTFCSAWAARDPAGLGQLIESGSIPQQVVSIAQAFIKNKH